MNDLDATTVIWSRREHISSLVGFFQKYFPSNSAQYDWMRDPFNTAAPADFSSAEEDQFIEVRSDSSLRLKFVSLTLSKFWIGVEREHPLIGQRAVRIWVAIAQSEGTWLGDLKVVGSSLTRPKKLCPLCGLAVGEC